MELFEELNYINLFLVAASRGVIHVYRKGSSHKKTILFRVKIRLSATVGLCTKFHPDLFAVFA